MNLHNIKKSGLALAAACMLAGSVQAAEAVKNAKLTDIVAFVNDAANKASQATKVYFLTADKSITCHQSTSS